MFTDGCCFRHPQEGLNAGYAIVRKVEQGFEEVETGQIMVRVSAESGIGGSNNGSGVGRRKESNHLYRLGLCGMGSPSGIVPRAASKIFDSITDTNQTRGWDEEIGVSSHEAIRGRSGQLQRT